MILLFSHPNFQSGDVPSGLLWAQPAADGGGVWGQWLVAGLQWTADQTQAQLYWDVCRQHKGRNILSSFAVGKGVNYLSDELLLSVIRVCFMAMASIGYREQRNESVFFLLAWGIHSGGSQQQQFNGDDWHAGAGGHSGHWEGSLLRGGLWTHHADKPDESPLVWFSLHPRGGTAGWQEAVYI